MLLTWNTCYALACVICETLLFGWLNNTEWNHVNNLQLSLQHFKCFTSVNVGQTQIQYFYLAFWFLYFYKGLEVCWHNCMLMNKAFYHVIWISTPVHADTINSSRCAVFFYVKVWIKWTYQQVIKLKCKCMF